MKIIVILIIAVSTFMSSHTYVYGFTITGYEWNKMSIDKKQGLIIGWLVAGDQSLNLLQFYVSQECPVFTLSDVPKFSEEFGFDLDGLSDYQVVMTVNKFYEDPRIMAWGIEEIMPFVRARLKESWTEKDIDEVIAYKIKEEELVKKVVTGEIKFEEYPNIMKTHFENRPICLKKLQTKFSHKFELRPIKFRRSP